MWIHIILIKEKENERAEDGRMARRVNLLGPTFIYYGG